MILYEIHVVEVVNKYACVLSLVFVVVKAMSRA